MIEVKNLTKKYGAKTAVDDLTFTLKPGKIYGFLGPNGAGKSTTMNMLTGNIAPTSGSVTIFGADIVKEPEKAKRHIGYLPEIPPLYPDMTPFEYLAFVAEAKGLDYDVAMRQIGEVMSVTKILDVKNRLIKNLSKGYCQRVGIAAAFLGDPDVIILDEPTVGLDPKQITEIRALIKSLGEKKTVVLSSHILAEISAVCDHVIMLSHGKLVADDSLRRLESRNSKNNIISLTVKGNEEDVTRIIRGIRGVNDCRKKTSDGVSITLEISADKGIDVRDAIFFAMAEKKYTITSMNMKESDLESIFLALTSEEGAMAESEAK